MMTPEKIALYDRLITTNSNFERKGKTMLYTSVNGHMFSQLNKAGEIGIRLSKEDGNRFMKEYQATVFKSYGAVMKGYVLIPEFMFEHMELIAKYLQKSYEFALTLPPKPAK